MGGGRGRTAGKSEQNPEVKELGVREGEEGAPWGRSEESGDEGGAASKGEAACSGLVLLFKRTP